MIRHTSIVFLSLALIGASSLAQTIRRVPSQYRTIQAAVNAAITGDTVLVDPGTYRENLNLTGKTITLVSAAGAADTIIHGGGGSPVITVDNSTIDGFTIQNGTATNVGMPIPCGTASGGGVYILLGSPIIRNNIIRNNRAGSYAYKGRGAGIGDMGFLFFRPVIYNNVITGNTAASGKCGAYGGGVCLVEGLLLNNTIYGNTGGGVYGDGGGSARTLTVINCLVWGNQGGLDIWGNVTTQTCHTITPKCMDAARGDFHLRWDSPCRDAGTVVAGLPGTDYEGDPRVHGSRPDIGADEFHPHIYATGQFTPGGVADVKLIGKPGSSTVWAYSLHPTLLNPPIPVPGLGAFYLAPPYWILPAGPTTGLGVTMVPVPLATWLPKPLDIPIQGLVGTQLTNPHVIRIR